MPLLVYGFRFGWQAVAMAGVAGWGVHGVLAAISGVIPEGTIFFSAGTLAYLMWNVVPALLTSWLVGHRARPATVLGVLSVCAAVGAAAATVLFPQLVQLWRETTAALSEQMQSPQAQKAITEASLARMAVWVPGLMGSVWLLVFMVNLALASRFVHVAGFGADVPRFSSLRVTEWGVIAAVISLTAGAMIGSDHAAGAMLSNAGIVLLAAVFIGGLALVHAKAARFAQPGIALMFFYLLSLLLGVPLIAALLAGAADAFFDFRNSSFRSRS